MSLTRAEIEKKIAAANVRFIRLQFVDIFGHLKNVSIPAREIDRILDGECMFDGSSIDGFVRVEESDMMLRPHLGSFSLFPWLEGEDRVARLLCDVYRSDGTPFVGDPRYVLRRALAEAEEMGLTFHAGPEMEFFLFDLDETGNPTTCSRDQAGYFDLGPVDRYEGVRRDICVMLEEMGFRIEASHHECAPAQHEIDFRYNEGLRVADDVVTFKMIVKSVARKKGMYATFMPKPIADVAGSGMHINMSLSKEGQNVFFDPDAKDGLSETALCFIAGLMAHAPAITAVTNPLVNSYKRLMAGHEAPRYIAWSDQNRSPLIRIPTARGNGTRVELRSPDPSCNPYLALAVCLSAGLHGIRQKLKPRRPVSGNIYGMNEQERRRLGIESLPKSLTDAIAALQRDELILGVLGEHIANRYIEAKRREWEEYRLQVTAWELERYLRVY